MPGTLDPHMMAEAVVQTEHPSHNSNEPPRSWGRTQLIGLAIFLLLLGLTAVGMWRFGEDTKLADTRWRLAGIYEGDDIDLIGPPLDPAAYVVTLEFDGREYRGDGPVNMYSGRYRTSGENLTRDSITRTERGGSPEAMGAEERYFMLLQAAERFTVDDASLTLFDRNGRELLRYERLQ